MCGIFFAAGCSSDTVLAQNVRTLEFLNRRGPDSNHSKEVAGFHSAHEQDRVRQPLKLTFNASVLSLRSDNIVPQPLEDEDTGCLLCWNGEAWMIDCQVVRGNDTLAVQHGLLEAVRKNKFESDRRDEESAASQDHVVTFLASISGPFTVVFYDAVGSKVYFARDCLGRRSLLFSHNANNLILSSVTDGNSVWSEIDADGVYVLRQDCGKRAIDASDRFNRQTGFLTDAGLCISHFPWTTYDKIAPFNRSLPAQTILIQNHPVHTLQTLLRDSLALRVGISQLGGHGTCPAQNGRIEEHNNANGLQLESPSSSKNSTRPERTLKFGILFSGGLDCSLIARIAHDLLPLDQEIDLLNVAFENPRQQKTHGNTAESPFELCPDRITARKAHAELLRVCPKRLWRLVAIDIPFQEAQLHRDTVLSLMYPHDTEMDRSIAMALYFAARGEGTVIDMSEGKKVHYASPARVLFSGLGADELFGGYQRHATAFNHSGFNGLIEALELDFQRLGKRNLGRDDRVTSHWGKEVRYPYLDEALVNWAVQTPAWEKCGFGQERQIVNDANALQLSPDKLIVRLLAWQLGMHGIACEKKRAIQFGARTAKMEARNKGTEKVVKDSAE